MARLPLNTQQLKPFLYLGFFIGAWLVLPPAFKNVVRDASYEFQAPFWNGTSRVRDLQTGVNLSTRPKRELIEAVRDLSRENALFQLERRRLDELKTYTARLEALLNLPSHPDYRYEVARVIRRDLGSWWQRLIIRKGEDYGFTEGLAVVFSGGVVGRVIRVHRHTSEVELVSSPTFRMAARFEGENRPVTFQGKVHTNFGPPLGTVSDVPPDIQASAAAPQTLVSTELGGTFPSGLTIGTVFRLRPGSGGLFQTGPVVLDRRLLTLQEVAVLIPLDAETGTIINPYTGRPSPPGRETEEPTR